MEGGTFQTTVSRAVSHTTVAELQTRPAGLGAILPRAKCSHPAIGRTGLDIALASLDQTWAGDTSVLDSAGNRAGTLTVTSTACLGAFSPRCEITHNAIDRTCLRAARAAFVQRRADFTTEEITVLYGTSACHFAATAGLAAQGPFSPGTDYAVNGADLGVAFARASLDSAGLAAVTDSAHDGPTASLGTSATGFGALAKRGEARQGAIYSAGVFVAATAFGQSWAGVPAVVVVGDDAASAAMRTTSTGFVTRSPVAPRRSVAVYWAGSASAHTSFLQLGASSATGTVLGHDSASTELNAITTSSGAARPINKFRNGTVNGTSVSVARSHLLQRKTGFATVGNLLDYLTVAIARATTTRFGAEGVCSPPRHDAINWACLFFASLVLFVRGGTFLATMRRRRCNAAGSLLVSSSTRL